MVLWILWHIMVACFLLSVYSWLLKNYGAFQVALVVKNLPANVGDIRDVGSIPGSERSPGEGHSNLLQYSCLENPMDRGIWWAIVHRVSESDMTKCLSIWKKWQWKNMSYLMAILMDWYPWMEEPGGLQSMGSLRVGHDWATSLSLFTFFFFFNFILFLNFTCIGEGNGNPLRCSCLENPRDWGAWWAAIYGVAQSWTWLKRLSSSSSSSDDLETVLRHVS